jgi:hypothetical protein
VPQLVVEDLGPTPRQNDSEGKDDTVPNNRHPLSSPSKHTTQRLISRVFHGPEENTNEKGPYYHADEMMSNCQTDSNSQLTESTFQSLGAAEVSRSRVSGPSTHSSIAVTTDGAQETGMFNQTTAVDATDVYEQMTPRVVGSSSCVGFIENVQEVLRHAPVKRGISSTPSKVIYDMSGHFGSSAGSERIRNSRQITPALVADLSLPPRNLMNRLLQKYWAEIHIMSPLLHEQTFMLR